MEAMVDFPLPEGPTIAVQEPDSNVSETFLRVQVLCRCGYVNDKELNWIGNGDARRFVPWASWDPRWGRFAR